MSDVSVDRAEGVVARLTINGHEAGLRALGKVSDQISIDVLREAMKHCGALEAISSTVRVIGEGDIVGAAAAASVEQDDRLGYPPSSNEAWMYVERVIGCATATCLDDQVVRYGPGELPAAEVKISDYRGCPYGRAIMTAVLDMLPVYGEANSE